MSAPIPILLVDDQVLFREAIRTVLSLEKSISVVAEAGNGQEAIDLVAKLRPQVVLMDLKMPVMSGIEATRRLRLAYPDIYILVLTTFDQEEEIFDALRAGAAGYVLKNTPATQLVHAIQTVASGQTYLQPSVATQVVAELNRLTKLVPTISKEQQIADQLSAREIDVVRLLVRGMSNKEIAGSLSVTEGTVKNHMTSILDKFQATDRTAVALRARDLGLG